MRPSAMKDGAPLTEAEAEIWRLQSRAGSAPCWIGEYLRIDGSIDPMLFEAALRHAVAAIASLNKAYVDTQDGPRKRLRPARGWTMPVEDLSEAEGATALAEARMRAVLAEAGGPLSGEPFRFALFRVGARCWLWFHAYHHVAMDGVGVREVAARVARSYSRLVEGGALADAEGGAGAEGAADDGEAGGGPWAALLRDWAGPLRLAGRAAPATRLAVTQPVRIGRVVATRLRRTARGAGLPLSHVLIAAAALWLNAAAGRVDIVLGLAVRARRVGKDPASSIPAMLTNVVPVRLRIAADSTVLALAQQVAAQRRAGRMHEQERAATVLRAVGMPAAQGYGPVVNVMAFDYGMTFGGACCEARNVSIGPVDELCLSIYDRKDGRGLAIAIDANPDLYDAGQLGLLARRLERLLIVLARAPLRRAADIDLLDAGERRTIEAWSAAPHAVTPAGIAGLFAAQVAARPGSPLLVQSGRAWSYGAIHVAARRLAARILRAFGGGIVAVLLPRSPEYFVAVLGIAMAGRAFAPIDPANPAARVAAMLEDCGAGGAVCLGSLAPLLPGGFPVLWSDDGGAAEPLLDGPPPVTDPAALAYVIFTSGTTGRPKAVAVPERGIASLAAYQAWHLRLDASCRILQFAAPGFDAVVMELLMVIAVGACLVQPQDEERLGPALGAFMARTGVTHALLPPSALLALDAAAQAAPATLIVGGEACPPALAARWSVGRRMINAYGPTEATACATMSEPLAGAGHPPIGRPVWNTRVHVLDPLGRRVPPGARGELHIAGAGVAAGYLGDAEGAGQRFVPCPFPPGGPMVRTGDEVRFRPDGSLECFGRADRQVKLRGVRIDPGEVEAALGRVPGIGQAVVVERQEPGGPARLVGYLLPAPGAGLDAARVRRAVAEHLPPVMIPSAFVVMDELPLTSSGKVDHGRLPAPAAEARAARPDTAGERQVAALLGAVLRRDGVSVDDDFFALGGDSISAALLVQRLNAVMGCTLTIADVFRHPGVGALAARIADRGAPTVSPFAVLLGLRAGDAAGALFCIHTGSGLGWAYSGLLRHLDPAVPVYAVQARGLDGRSALAPDLESLAQDYVDEIRRVQPAGPYHLLGWSSGGPLAHLVATRLQALGQEVGLLVSLDGYPAGPFYGTGIPGPAQREAAREDLRQAIQLYLASGQAAGVDRRDVLDDDALGRMIDIHVNTGQLLAAGRLGRFRGDLLLFTCRVPYGPDPMPPPDTWRAFVAGRVEAIEVDCHHDAMLMPQPAAVIGRAVAARLAAHRQPRAEVA